MNFFDKQLPNSDNTGIVTDQNDDFQILDRYLRPFSIAACFLALIVFVHIL